MRVGSQQTGRNEGLRNGGIERRRGVCVAGGQAVKRPGPASSSGCGGNVGRTWHLGLESPAKKETKRRPGWIKLARVARRAVFAMPVRPRRAARRRRTALSTANERFLVAALRIQLAQAGPPAWQVDTASVREHHDSQVPAPWQGS